MDRDDKGINIASQRGISGFLSESASGLREAQNVSGQVSLQTDSATASQEMTISTLVPFIQRREKRRRNRVRKSDLMSAIEAVIATGAEFSHVEVDAVNGKFIVFTSRAEPAPQNAFKDWKKNRAHKA